MKKHFRTLTLPQLWVAGAILAAVSPATAGSLTFTTLDNNSDPTFNQLLGINDAGEIVGYFGSGMTGHPNKGYTLTPPYGQVQYTNENFPMSAQTQVVGVNNNSSPTTVGFWIDGNGNNAGFVNSNGTFTSVVDPNTPTATAMTPAVNQLLGVSDNGVAAGFYVDGNGNDQAYTYNTNSQLFTPVFLPAGFLATMTVATGINNQGVISGFYMDINGNIHGFLDSNGGDIITSLDDPAGNGTSTMLLGLNNNGQGVGSYVDANGETHGLLYNIIGNSFKTIDDPFASANAAFDVTGTTVNGINDQGQLVGFYSDGTNVNGFLASSATPEPATIWPAAFGCILLTVGMRRRK